MITDMLSTSRHVRRHAFDRLEPSRQAAHAARELLAFDEDASVRARAAFFVSRCDADVARPALHDAADDPMPLVRHAAVRSLASCGDSTSLAIVSRAALEDPIWWVRRAAVVTVAIVGKTAAIATLRACLEDPFWRVRNAAVRTLLALGEHEDGLVDRLGPATSPRSEGALAYIARRLGARTPVAREIDVPNEIVAKLDPDPAVVTARLSAGEKVPLAFLVECLGDPHEALRVTAKKRLAKSGDVRAFELAMLWLDEPRIPHAAQTVVELFDALEREDVERVLDIAFERGFGAICWAASYVGLTADTTRKDALLRHLHHEHPMVRCAVIAALGELGEIEPLGAMLDDSDARVVRTAAQALFEKGALEGAPRGDVHTRRLYAAAGARDSLRDEDVRTRAIAIAALGEKERAAFVADADPWIRAAAVEDTSAAELLASDPQPWVRRAAYRVLDRVDRARASELACACDDPWLKTRGIAHLDPRNDRHLVTLLRLSRDSSSAVRSAAWDALERKDVDGALDRLLAGELDDVARIAALTHRSRRFEDADFARLHAARDGATEAVRAWLDDVLDVAPPHPTPVEVDPIEPAPLRPLGATGIDVSHLVISGAGMLRARDYAAAMRRGCNTFFWEPRYHTLGRMLARERDAQVVCGTYEASERAIVADVERYLRRLRRDALDVFLLFWARSPARVDAPIHAILERLRKEGKIRAFGFSTHDRQLACDAMNARAWDVVMTRHSAVHPGAEARVFPTARDKNVGLLGFSALSYGRALSPTISAGEAYRHSLSQPGVSAVLSAPRSIRELDENLDVLRAPPLSASRQAELRAYGKTVHEESADFARSIRRHPIALSDVTTWLDRDNVEDVPRASQS